MLITIIIACNITQYYRRKLKFLRPENFDVKHFGYVIY
jgi:hypothetical protein